MESSEDPIAWIAGAAVAIVGAAAAMIRSISKRENGQKEFRAAIRDDIHHLEKIADRLQADVVTLGNRVVAIETRLNLKDK